jgi:hypothetical protein
MEAVTTDYAKRKVPPTRGRTRAGLEAPAAASARRLPQTQLQGLRWGQRPLHFTRYAKQLGNRF